MQILSLHNGFTRLFILLRGSVSPKETSSEYASRLQGGPLSDNEFGYWHCACIHNF